MVCSKGEVKESLEQRLLTSKAFRETNKGP